MVIAEIQNHVAKLMPLQIFSTRELLIYGPRGAVDTALHRLVRGQEIIRVANGLFIKNDGSGRLPSVIEIAKEKARISSREIYLIGESLVNEDDSPTLMDDSATFITTGGTTSFRLTHGGTVQFVAWRPRELRQNSTRSHADNKRRKRKTGLI
jgi:hypothetical protein